MTPARRAEIATILDEEGYVNDEIADELLAALDTASEQVEVWTDWAMKYKAERDALTARLDAAEKVCRWAEDKGEAALLVDAWRGLTS